MLVSDAIQQAFREADVITIGNTPTDDEMSEALALLNSYIQRLFGTEFGENLVDWPCPPANGQRRPDSLVAPQLGNTWYLLPTTNSRVLLKFVEDGTITFPREPNDGSQLMFVDVGSNSVNLTLNGNGRLIAGNATQIDTPQAFNSKRYFYRADLASWTLVGAVGLNDTLPLVADFDDLFITYLAIRLMPRNAQETSTETATVFKDLQAKARRRYRQEQPTAVADPRISEGLNSFGSFHGPHGWLV